MSTLGEYGRAFMARTICEGSGQLVAPSNDHCSGLCPVCGERVATNLSGYAFTHETDR